MTTPARRLATGDPAPPIDLGVIGGGSTAARVALDPSAGPATVIVFTADGCPFARAWHDRIQAVARDYADRGVPVLQLLSNDATDHPEDGPAAAADRVNGGEFAGPLLWDAEQAVARAYGATATPEVFVVDATGTVRYHGAPDGDHDDAAQNASWVRDALDDLLAGRPVTRPNTSPAGCSIKWRVELRWWEGCPTHERAEELLTDVLTELNRGEVHVVRREVRTRADAQQLGFVGSPTFAVGGQDLFESDAQPALTCRLYHPTAGVVRSPAPSELADRLRDALARPWELPGWVDFRKTRTPHVAEKRSA